MPLSELTGALGRKRAAHLLRRACFGGSISEIESFASLTPAQAVEQLFDAELPEPALPVDPLTGTEWITTGAAQSEENELRTYFLAWNLGQMLGNEIQEEQKLSYIFRERIVFFLHSHFTTKQSIVGNSRSLHYQQSLFRLFSFDQEELRVPSEDPLLPDTTAARNFKALTKKICVDNAMLIFLDGRLNVKGSPNENYARELLELFSVGRGLEGNIPEPEFVGDYTYFTEEDVRAGARVLSGFNIDTTFSNIDEETGLPRGVVRGGTIASSHEEGVKTFSSRLGNGIVTPDEDLQTNGNPTEESVLDEISQLVDLIYEQDETAIHICREIYRFFVYHQVDEVLQDDIIRDMADIFIANDYKLQPVLEALFSSEHFYEADATEDDNNFGGIIKSPLDLVIGFHRNFEIPLPSYETDLESYYEYTTGLLNLLENLGMNYYEPFEVAGYAAYHQFPIFNRNWITTNYLTNRYSYIQNSLPVMVEEAGQVDIVAFVQANFSDDIASDARSLIAAVAAYFLPSAENLSFVDSPTSELTTERLNYFLTAFLFSPQIDPDPEEQWTFRWQNGIGDEVVRNQLINLFNAMLQTPEYQLM